MLKRSRPKFLIALKGIVLCVPLFILQINYAGWAQSPQAEVKTLDAEVNAYIWQLKDHDVTVRVSAASALGRSILGNPNFANPPKSGEIAVRALVKALREDREETVRVSAAVAIGKRSYPPTTPEDVEFLAKLAVPELIKTLKDDKEVAGVRARAANSIGEISRAIKKITNKSLQEVIGNEETINELVGIFITTLKHQDVQVSASAAYALGTMGSGASTAVPTLINLLKDKKQDVIVRAKAAETLGNADLKGSSNREAVSALISTLNEKETKKIDASFLRASAALALGSMVSDPKIAVPSLFTDLKVNDVLKVALKDKEALVRSNAANALGLMRSNAANAISDLIAVMENDNEDELVRTDVINALGKIASDSKVPNSKRLVSALLGILKNGREKSYVRQAAAYALGNVGLESEEAVRSLIEVVEDIGEDKQVCQYAAYALQIFFKNQAYQDPTKNQEKFLIFRIWKQFLIVRDADNAYKALEKAKQKDNLFLEEIKKEVNWYLEIIKLQLNFLIFNWIQKNPFILVLILYFLVLPSLWLFIFLLNPIGVFYIKQTFNRFKGIDLPYPFSGGFKLTIDILTFISFLDFFCYRLRVLDKWVSNHYKLFNKNVLALVRKFDDYEPIAVDLDGASVTKLTIKELQPIFSKNLTCLVIQGEGGKKLACQLAKWAMSKDKTERICEHIMLPVLINDFKLNSENKADENFFINAISRQVRNLLEATDSMLPELLDQLLRQRRVLVIVDVDEFSEMSDTKTLEIKNLLLNPAFPVNALVIKSQNKLEMKEGTYSLCQIR
ncbi:HEAT repeat domain-containing protein [Nostoc commune]|uniref:HEAT repeat domain-containing protein n=1 Tax=Nostoc commune TaxID=1178 RepID=UPI0018C78C72|nr:HEAT repeat domain-containing protein [Nostoc commune]MBG1258380.1 HEAT repeat domain-containing protein [Nostoc commune BAE]